MQRSNLPPWKTKLLLGYIFTIIGGSFLLASFGTFAHEFYFLKESSPTTGIVIANIESRSHIDSDPKGGGTGTVIITLCPQFQYAGSDGVERTATSKSCASPPSYQPGQEVPVRFLKANPANAQIDSFAQKWTLSIAFGAVAVLLLPVGCFFLWLTKWRGLSLDPLTLFDSVNIKS